MGLLALDAIGVLLKLNEENTSIGLNSSSIRKEQVKAERSCLFPSSYKSSALVAMAPL